ncbi:hypothetical protein L1987_22444 [Smallanthus sonchifolius]|uniref:Uncharacterized protein n=1 Tax=Smallanthus sonchifolius TaxID=185202 RepID=A0ACB9IFF5_9ASTR|nr:hypothetical protein L1987_22444 [Smallanthus sonchifolius]
MQLSVFNNIRPTQKGFIRARLKWSSFNFQLLRSGSLNYLHLFPSRKILLPVLHDLSGIIKPGRRENDNAIGPTKLWKNNTAFGFGWKTWVRFKGKRA